MLLKRVSLQNQCVRINVGLIAKNIHKNKKKYFKPKTDKLYDFFVLYIKCFELAFELQAHEMAHHYDINTQNFVKIN